MKKVKIKEVYEKDPGGDVQEPILIRFQHAQINTSNTGADLNKVFSSAVFQSCLNASPSKDFSHLSRSGFDQNRINQSRDCSGGKPGAKKRKQLVALQTESMTYIGSNNMDDMLRTFVALRSGKKMKVYEVTPITVSPFIKGHSHVVEKERDTDIKKTKEERKASNIDLVKAFGSKKKRLTYERIEKHQIDVSDMNESMNRASEQIKVPEEEPKMKDESVLTLIPPCNREALDVHGVYNLDDLISPDEIDSMDELAEQFLNLSNEEIKEWHAARKYSDYFFGMWNKLHVKKSDPRVIKSAKIVLYTELLISLLKLGHNQIRKKVPELPDVFPLWLREKALEGFTVANAKGIRNRPEASKDKTCCYIMVLALFANDYLFDVQLMSTSLNVHIKKLLTLAKAVGITLHLNHSTKEHQGVLKLPLPKPIETRGRRRALR